MAKADGQSRLGSTERLRRMRFALGTLARRVYSPLGHAHVLPFRERRDDKLVDPVKINLEGVTWVAVRVAHGCERMVADDLSAVGYRAYCPLGRKLAFRARSRNGKRERRVSQFAVFARYVFVGCPRGTGLGKHAHERIEAVIGDSRGPLAIAGSAIRAINELEIAGQWDSTRRWADKAPFRVGASVRLGDGPFVGFEGVVAKLPKEMRVVVELSLFGVPTCAEVDARQLEVV